MAAPVRHVPTRTCVACRATRPKRELVRVVRGADGSVTLDHSGRLAGRGAYLCADGSCWATASKKSSVERALGVPLPADLRSVIAEARPDLLTGGAHGA